MKYLLTLFTALTFIGCGGITDASVEEKKTNQEQKIVVYASKHKVVSDTLFLSIDKVIYSQTELSKEIKVYPYNFNEVFKGTSALYTLHKVNNHFSIN